MSLFVGGNNNVRGAAVDPNPGAVPGRDVYYVAHAIDEVSTYLVRKIVADCTGTADADYGNHNWFGNWNAIVGMAVDPGTGDLYIAAKTEIYKIAPDESITLVKGGFTSVNGIDVVRDGATDPGLLLVADGGVANTVKALALDNTSASPMTIATASILRASAFGALVSGGPWLASNVNRTVVVHNNGNSGAVNPVRPDPLVEVRPVGPFEIRISSPSTTEQLPDGQSRMRPSTFGDTSFSQSFTELQYRDGLSRFTCAWVGDPGAGAPQYDTAPPTPASCNKPRTFAVGNCDNGADIATGGPGSFVESGNPLQSCKTCGSASSPCRWEFRITNRFGGDNYKAYFAFDSSSNDFAATSDIYTSWKHVHLERDRMCKVGGLLFQDYGAPGECGGAGEPVCCGTGGQPPCNQIVLYGPTGLQQNDSLTIFDAIPYKTGAVTRTFEQGGETRTVAVAPVDNGNGTVTVTLSAPALAHSYRAADPVSPSPPTTPAFTNGHSGGVCVGAGGFWEADASDFPQPYGDALTSAHVPAPGLAGTGSGTIPFVPSAFLNSSTRPCTMRRFSRIWFNGFSQGPTITNCPDPPANVCNATNQFHMNGAQAESSSPALAGASLADANFSYVYGAQIATDCTITTGGCTPSKEANMIRFVTAHEFGHQFRVDDCSSLHDSRNAWCGPAGGTCVDFTLAEEKCVMYNGNAAGRDMDLRANGIDHFCPEDLILGDPNCIGTPRPGAIRTWEDPQ